MEIQTTFMDAYAMGNTTDPTLHEIFTIYHVKSVSDAFGLVAGPLNSDASLTNKDFGGPNGDSYYASRRGATTDGSRRGVVSASLSTWYHIKAEIDLIALNIKFTVTKQADGTAVGSPLTLSLPANFSMVDGIGRLMNSAAGTGSGCTFDDRLDNLAIKNADVFTPGQKVESIDITQLDGLTTVIAGKTTQLKATVLPVDVEVRKLTWSSTGPTYATVDQGGLVSGLEAGIGQTVGIVAAATDGSEVTDTFYIEVIAQPVTGITVAGNSTHYIISENTETATLTATIAPEDASSKLLTWTTASALRLDTVVAIQTVNATTDTVTILLKTFGNDTIIATANDGRGAVAKFPVVVELNPYPGYQYVETFNAALNGAVQGLRGGPGSIGAKDADNPSDRVLKYSSSDGAARASAYNFNSVTSFTQKAVVEFDLNLQSKASGEGIISFMSNSTPSDNDNHDVFSIFAVNDATGFGVSVGYIQRVDHTNSDHYQYVNEPRRIQESVLAANKGWVPAPISADIWYHVQAVIYANERIDFLFTRGADTFRITLPTTEALKTSIGAINLAGTTTGTWTSAVDNIGIRVADADTVVPATGVKVSSEYDKVSLGGNIPVTAAVLPWDVTSHAVTWGVANPAIATVAVEAGNPSWVATLTGVSGGTARVFATVDGAAIADTLSIPVQVILVDSLYIQGSTSVSVGHSIAITKSNAEVWPANAGDKSVTWSASNASVSIAPSGDTCIVTGVNAGAGERDSVLIIGAATDGGGAADTIKVYVEFTHATRLDLQGDRRVFYGDPTGQTIALTPAFTPSTASDMVITGYESTDSSILTVNSSGVATLAGGYGKAAVKAVAHDGSLEGYYYVEVAAQNPYDEFNDFEAPLHNDPALKLDTFAFVSNGGSAGYDAAFRNTGTLKFEVVDAVNRGMAMQFVDGPLTGERITLRFDFFAGKSSLQSTGAKIRYGSISIQDNTTAPISGNANTGYANRILTIAFLPATESGHNFFYFVGNDDLFAVDYPGDADGLPGTQAQRDTSKWDFLPELSALDTWYTLEATIDNYLHTVSFTITEVDAPEHTQTVVSVPFINSAPEQQAVGSIYVLSNRSSAGRASLVSAIDNFGYKSIDSLEHISVTLNPDGGIFSGDDISAPRVLPAVANEPIASLPEILRTGYTFAGWRYADGTAYAETDVYTANTELTAAWDIICYMVHFEGIDAPDTCVNHGTHAVKPGGQDPERECYNFEGWYLLNNTLWSFPTTTITEPVTIVARWSAVANCNPDTTGSGNNTAVASDVLSAVLLYPNPASDFVTVSGLEGGEAISVIDAGGSLLFTRKTTSDKESIAVGTLPSGIYYVQVAKGKATKTLKLTVR
jgi:uncharacterized protein YjdB